MKPMAQRKPPVSKEERITLQRNSLRCFLKSRINTVSRLNAPMCGLNVSRTMPVVVKATFSLRRE